MGMTVTACYIFLAVVLAPALTRAGLDPLAVHLFIMYWGMVSFITPPVALGAFRCGDDCADKPDHGRSGSHAAGFDHLYRAVLLRPESGPDRSRQCL